jgi:hypothetical protein
MIGGVQILSHLWSLRMGQEVASSAFRLLGSENPIPPRDRESHVNAINKAEFIELASQGQAPTQTHRSDWADKTPSLFREDLI